MTEILTDQGKKTQLKIELAVVIDAGVYFVKGTYNLEGVGPLTMTTLRRATKIYSFIGLPHYPDLMACATNLANGKTVVSQQLITYGKSCVELRFQSFKAKFDVELKPVASSF